MRVEIKITKKPELKEPYLVCGLPGSGYVGKLAADHLVTELKAEFFAEIYSDSFPPHVLIKKDGSVDLVRNELYFWRNPALTGDLIIYTGDSQPVSPEGDYEVADRVLDAAADLGVRNVFTFGAYITGAFTSRPRVFATATDASMLQQAQKLGMIVTSEGTITGMNGLILGLAKIRDMKGICLLGETSGYIVDAKAAQMILEVFTKMVGIQVDMATLQERAREVEAVIRAIGEAHQRAHEKAPGKTRLEYIS